MREALNDVKNSFLFFVTGCSNAIQIRCMIYPDFSRGLTLTVDTLLREIIR